MEGQTALAGEYIVVPSSNLLTLMTRHVRYPRTALATQPGRVEGAMWVARYEKGKLLCRVETFLGVKGSCADVHPNQQVISFGIA